MYQKQRAQIEASQARALKISRLLMAFLYDMNEQKTAQSEVAVLP